MRRVEAVERLKRLREQRQKTLESLQGLSMIHAFLEGYTEDIGGFVRKVEYMGLVWEGVRDSICVRNVEELRVRIDTVGPEGCTSLP